MVPGLDLVVTHHLKHTSHVVHALQVLDGDRSKLGHRLDEILREDVAVLGNSLEHDRVGHLEQRCAQVASLFIEIVVIGIDEQVKQLERLVRLHVSCLQRGSVKAFQKGPQRPTWKSQPDCFRVQP